MIYNPESHLSSLISEMIKVFRKHHYKNLGDKLKKIADYVENFLVKARNLPINFEKTEILSPNDSFEYLGYEFKGKNIRIAKRNCKKMKQKLRDVIYCSNSNRRSKRIPFSRIPGATSG